VGEFRPPNRDLSDYGSRGGRYPTTSTPDHGRKPSTFEPPGGRNSTILELTLKTVVEKLPSNSQTVGGFRPPGLRRSATMSGIPSCVIFEMDNL